MYLSLVELIKQYQQQNITQATIQKTLAFSSQFIDLGKRYPNQLVAQLQFYKPSASFFTNLTFNQVLATYIVASRNQWNDTAMQHLLCSCVCQFSGLAGSMEQWSQNSETQIQRKQITQHNMPLMRALLKRKLDIWLEGVKHAELRWHSHHERTLTPIAHQSTTLKVLAISNCIALYMTRTQHTKALNFSQTLRLIARKITACDYALIEPLLSFPSLTPPGSLISPNNGEFQLVLSLIENEQSIEKYITKPFHAKTKQCIGDAQLTIPSSIQKSLGPQPLKNIEHFEQWWDKSWEDLIEAQTAHPEATSPLHSTLFRVDAPPPTLLAIQEHLYSNDFDTNVLTELILKEPVFALHIKSTATQSSRENIAIKDVKHGLLMHGFERASSILMDHALTLRLNQNYFPTQEALLQYTTLFKYIVSSIASLKKGMTPELLSCWAGFASSGLFTLPSLKTKMTLPTTVKSGPKISCLMDLENQELLTQHAIKLAQSWDQPKQLLLALRSLEQEENFTAPKQHQTIAFILGLGCVLTKVAYWADYALTQEEVSLINQSTEVLNISGFNSTEVITSALSKAHTYSPLY